MKLIKLTAVTGMTGLCSSSIYNLIADGTFPKQVSLTAKSVAWVESEIEDWILERIKMRDTNHQTEKAY